MKRFLRSLVPEFPWCAAVAARCALAILVADAATLLLRVGVAIWRQIEVWRLLHGLDPLVAPAASGGATAVPEAMAVVTVSFSVVSSTALLALALLGVSHVLSSLSDLRVPEPHRPAPRGGATALAVALGAALALFALLQIAVSGARPAFAPRGLFWLRWAWTGLGGLAAALGLAALPFCLLRLAGRRFAAPPADSPEDADVRRLEAWLSIALAGGVAALAGDAAWTLLGSFLGLSFVRPPLSAFLIGLVQPVLSLCILAAVRDALRRLLSAGELPSAPGGRGGPLAAVVALLAASALLLTPLFVLFGARVWAEFAAEPARLAALLLGVGAFALQLVFCAVLVRRLPVPPGAQPEPAPPAFAGPARAKIGLALALAAIALALLGALATAAPCLAAAFALCGGAGARRARPRLARIGLAAAAVALVCLAFSAPAVRIDGHRLPEPVALSDTDFDWSAVAACVTVREANGVPDDRWIEPPVAWSAGERALLGGWASTMEDAPLAPPADALDSMASLSGPGFQAFFLEGGVLLYNGYEVRSRPLADIDRQVVDMLRLKADAPSPAEESARP